MCSVPTASGSLARAAGWSIGVASARWAHLAAMAFHRTAALSDDHDIAEKRRPSISPALKLRTDDPGRDELSVERVHWPA